MSDLNLGGRRLGTRVNATSDERWMVIELDDDVHAVPIDDEFEHEDGHHCWCNPRVDKEVRFLVVHNAFDGRELFEGLKDV